MTDLRFFTHERLTEHLWRVTEGYSATHRFTIGVVVGDDRVLVIDAGLGATDGLRRYVEGLVGTEKPIVCAATHGHPDHVGSAMLFDEAYLNVRDHGRAREFATVTEQRLEDLHGFCMEDPEVLAHAAEHHLVTEDTVFRSVDEGDEFDLGGVVVEIVAIPGHSPGFLAFYERTEGWVFTGDGVTTDVRLSKADRADVEAYAATLRRFVAVMEREVGPDVVLYPAHLPLAMTLDVPRNLAAACDDVVAGRTRHDPPAETIFGAKSDDPAMRMHIVGNACLVYDRDRVGVTTPGPSSPYSHERLSDRVLVVTENHSVVHRLTIPVVVGDERVAVVDAGLGVDDGLRTYVESIVPPGRELVCVLTQATADHAGGASAFDRVIVPGADLPALDDAVAEDTRLTVLAAYALGNSESIRDAGQRLLRGPVREAESITDGARIDLGGTALTAVRIGAATVGQTAYLVEGADVDGADLVLAGDAVDVVVDLSTSASDLGTYVDRIRHLVELSGPTARVLPAHHNRPVSLAVTADLVAAAQDVLDGRVHGDPPADAILPTDRGRASRRTHWHGGTAVVHDRARRTTP